VETLALPFFDDGLATSCPRVALACIRTIKCRNTYGVDKKDFKAKETISQAFTVFRLLHMHQQRRDVWIALVVMFVTWPCPERKIWCNPRNVCQVQITGGNLWYKGHFFQETENEILE
jgi:hypothetical protein